MKILFVATIMGHFKGCHLPYMKLLKEKGWEVHAAANNDVEIPYCDKKFIIPIERSPYKLINYRAYRQLKEILNKEKYDIIHCNTPMGGVLARLAAHATKKNGTKVIYTAHGFHFFKGAPIQNWLIYYPVERYLSKYTDILITINKEDFSRAKKFNANMVKYIPGMGIDTNKFSSSKINRSEKREELGVSNDKIVILSVGELNENKNHEVVIRAIANIGNPNLQYLICGVGPLESHLKSIAKEVGVESQVNLLGFRSDIAEICKSSDIFVFPSKREGLGLAALEAMASGLPIITSNIHGINDYSIDGKTGYKCNSNDVDDFAEKINNLVSDTNLRKTIGIHNSQAAKRFDVKNIIKIMDDIYVDVKHNKLD